MENYDVKCDDLIDMLEDAVPIDPNYGYIQVRPYLNGKYGIEINGTLLGEPDTYEKSVDKIRFLEKFIEVISEPNSGFSFYK